MATKPRHLKTPIQRWIVDERKRLELTPGDLAALANVSEDTARGWESRGRPSEDAIAILERRFGSSAPRNDNAPAGYGADVAAAIEAQTVVIRDLVAELRETRSLRDEVAGLQTLVGQMAAQLLLEQELSARLARHVRLDREESEVR